MSYRVLVSPGVKRKIGSWGLPAFLIVDIHLRLREELTRRAAELLERSRQPFDGMLYRFAVIDPTDRLTEHFCYFHILFGQDEETLHVINFNYVRQSG